MSKARVGTGKLEPFKKGDTGSTSIGGSTGKEHVREGFMKNVQITKVSREESKLEPFKTGSEAPGRNTSEGKVPAFRKRDNGIPAMPKPFKE
jgi:hypothetical protein